MLVSDRVSAPKGGVEYALKNFEGILVSFPSKSVRDGPDFRGEIETVVLGRSIA